MFSEILLFYSCYLSMSVYILQNLVLCLNKLHTVRLSENRVPKTIRGAQSEEESEVWR